MNFDDAEILMVGNQKYIYQNVFGKEVGESITKLAEQHRVKNVQGKIKSVKLDGEQKLVVLESGQEIRADLILYGIGGDIDTKYLSGGVKDPQNALLVNNYLQLPDNPNIYAAGEVAKIGLKGRFRRIPHYTEAINQGTFAGWNMMGKNLPYQTVPFFWTSIFKTKYCFTGYEMSGTEVLFKKDFDSEGNFVAFNCDSQ